MFRALLNLNYWCVLAFLMLSSCIQYKNIPYLQEETASEYEINPPKEEYKVRKGDLLHIDLKTFETSTKEFFEGTQGAGLQGAGGGTGNPQLFFKDFTVDQAGMIDLPIVGKLAVEGKVLSVISTELEGKLKSYIKFTKINIRLANYRVTVLGEVNNTGVQYIYESSYTLLQALSNAGDLTEFGNRKNVKLIRKNGSKVKSILIDLTNPQFLSSEYYYLQPDDLIYVEPIKAKTLKSNVQNVGILVSIISIAATLFTLITR